MDPTIVVLLIAVGGAIAAGAAVLGVFALADFVLSRLARRRNANGAQDTVPQEQSSVYGDRPSTARRSGAKTEHLDPVRVQHLIVELHRTRSILLGWLSVLEAFALGDAWRATALRAELGDINTCDISLVGDANVIATYQLTVDMLRNQAGRGLPPEVASDMASIRVRLLTALAEQERRLNHGEKPVIAEPLVHLDLWGPPRPITEVTIRPPTPTLQPLLGDSSTSSPALSDQPVAEPPIVVRPVTVGLPALLDGPRETTSALLNPPTPSPVPTPAGPALATAKPPIARRAKPQPASTQAIAQPRATKAPAPRAAARAAAAAVPPPSAKATARPATKSTAPAATKPATVVEAAPSKPARRIAPAPAPAPAPALAPHLVPTAVPTPRSVRTVAKPAPLGAPSTAPVAVSRPTQVLASRPVPIGASKPIAPGPRPAARATLGPMSQSASSPGGKAPTRPTSKRSEP
jgi:hypothetical protein